MSLSSKDGEEEDGKKRFTANLSDSMIMIGFLFLFHVDMKSLLVTTTTLRTFYTFQRNARS